MLVSPIDIRSLRKSLDSLFFSVLLSLLECWILRSCSQYRSALVRATTQVISASLAGDMQAARSLVIKPFASDWPITNCVGPRNSNFHKTAFFRLNLLVFLMKWILPYASLPYRALGHRNFFDRRFQLVVPLENFILLESTHLVQSLHVRLSSWSFSILKLFLQNRIGTKRT